MLLRQPDIVAVAGPARQAPRACHQALHGPGRPYQHWRGNWNIVTVQCRLKAHTESPHRMIPNLVSWAETGKARCKPLSLYTFLAGSRSAVYLQQASEPCSCCTLHHVASTSCAAAKRKRLYNTGWLSGSCIAAALARPATKNHQQHCVVLPVQQKLHPPPQNCSLSTGNGLFLVHLPPASRCSRHSHRASRVWHPGHGPSVA